MYHSYVGIIDARGLNAFLSEEAVSADWLLLQASRGTGACFRALVPAGAADDIRTELFAGHRRDAMLLLDGVAVELSPLGSDR